MILPLYKSDDQDLMMMQTKWKSILDPLLAAISVPVGTVVDFAGDTAPDGWLLCDGSAVSRVQYRDLYNCIKTKFGVGDNNNTFNVPDKRRRVSVGAGGTGTATLASTVGSSGGEESHTLSGAESGVAAHSHGITDPGHAHNVTSASNVLGGGSSYKAPDTGTTSSPTSASVTSITINNATATAAANAHNNIQPSIVFNSIIKF